MPENSVLDTVGRTPLLRIDGLFVKCEYMNPSGSIKARMMKYFVERAEKEGAIKPGDTIVEATSGNTGNALAMVCAAKGYKALVLMPEGFSKERIHMSRAYGAEVRFVGRYQLNEAVAEAKRLGEQPGFFCPRQFDNEWNIEENAEWLGAEIVAQLPPDVRIDAVVQGVGTGGTLIGVGKALRRHHNANVKLFAVEPAESRTISRGEIGHHLIEGISDGFIPPLLERNMQEVDGVIDIESNQSVECMKMLARTKGFLVGVSSGANFLAAKKIIKDNPSIRTVLTFFCDEGEKYLSQYYAS